MVFSSIPFLFYFLPLTLAVYFLCPRVLKNGVLFFASLLFYAWGEPVYVFIMLFSTVVDYTHGILIEYYINKNENNKAKAAMISSVVINLALLCFFKYTDFFILNVNTIFNTDFNALGLPLPIGISFYTFQTMSYSIDVYRRQVKAQKNIISFGAYVAFFPQLIAGPIVQYKTVAEALNNRKESVDGFAEGIMRFISGLGKKVLIANNIGMVWDKISAMDVATLPVLMAWMGILAFSFQIYFDFSGYSDMAIGLGKMFGFTFPENFNYPYVSKSITDFWRRWHISLGTWFREYVYIPLGGNRKGTYRNMLNIMLVWFLTGFWHGSAWNFIIWGIYFGIILIVEKQFIGKWLAKINPVFQHLYALVFIVLGWVVFAFDSVSALGMYLKAMFGLNANALVNSQSLYVLGTSYILFLIAIVGSTPLPKKVVGVVFKESKNEYLMGTAEVIYMAVTAVFSVAYIINSSYNPFLYFRF